MTLKDRAWYNLTTEEALSTLEVEEGQGLDSGTAEARLHQYGRNVLGEAKPTHPLAIFLNQFKDFMIYVLLAAAVVSGALLKEWVDMAVILAIVLANAVLGFVQEFRAEKALMALKKLSAPTVRVRRAGKVETVAAEALVPGDIMLIEEGDHISADARLLAVSSLRVNEASLTGEAEASAKRTAGLEAASLGPGDQDNMIFQGTFVEKGRGEAVVVETGRRTQMGAIATLLEEAEESRTPLQEELDVTGKRIALLCLAICALIFGLGLIEGEQWETLFLFSVSLAVAAIPEGLAAIVTVALSLGVRRMAEEKAIIRRLAAVETLGSTSVICTDKTGTLTRSEMTARQVWMPEVEHIDLDFEEGSEEAAETASAVLVISTLCNDAWWQEGGFVGEGTEVGLLKMAESLGFDRERFTALYPRTGEIPFESDRKMMSTLHRVEDSKLAEEEFELAGSPYLLFSKGAPEVIASRCARIHMPGGAAPLTHETNSLVLGEAEEMAGRGLRTLAFSYRPLDRMPDDLEDASLETEEIFAGLVGMIDPPRPEVLPALEACRQAHIGVVMITGDHAVTASAIATELGILTPEEDVMPGHELSLISDEELAARVENIGVYARVSPADKVKIVSAWKARGAVVAMTGDGVNDAPALKHADIGVAMGITGTDVSKEAADMVLADDNFATIVQAVNEGRVIFENLKKFIYFLLSCNISEVVTMFLAMIIVGEAPLLAVQVLWINLVTDGFPAMALGVDTPSPGIMTRYPRDLAERVLSGRKLLMLAWQGVLLATGALTAFFLARYWLYADFFAFSDEALQEPGLQAVQTVVFCTLVFAQLLHSYNCRSEHVSFFKMKFFDNRMLPLSLIVSLALQIVVVTVPPLMEAFGTTSLTSTAWLVVLGCSLAPVLLIDRIKVFVNRDKRA